MAGQINGLGVAYVLSGFVLLWSGVKGSTIKDTLTSFLKGQSPTPGSANEPIDVGTVEQSDLDSGTSIPGVTQGIPAGVASSGTPTANKAVGQMMAAAYGWGTGDEWSYLESGWEEESGWNQYAANPSSEAYGIPQANPYTKMPKSAWPASAGGSSSVTAQISWGLSYIKSTYGSPTGVPGWSADGPTAGYTGY
jgi:resuscitation-promoting factor RpfB